MTVTSKIIDNTLDLEKAFEIRKEIFVKEQLVPLEDELDEYDNLDSNCIHVLLSYNDAPVGTGRVRKVGDYAKIERICVIKGYRKYGIGKEIVFALEQAALNKNWNFALLHGQTHAKMFYEKLGYVTASEEFMEDGIPHILMKKDLIAD